MGKLKKNLTYQTIYQVLITITPLITSPYLSRKLGASSLGIYSYTQSIVNYFILFAMLGFSNYGTRTIALCKSKDEEDKTFCEIYTLQLICSFISLILYCFLSFMYSYNTTYLLLQSFWVISCLFDVTWYFFGKEEYKTTVTRNIIIKILTILCILLFIKKPSDVGLYILIMSGSTCISQMILWIIIRKRVKIKLFNLKESFSKHFKSVIVLFIPILAMSVYQIMDKTMLGMFSTDKQSGFYYNSDKIVNIPLGVLNGLGTVMLSRMSVLQKEKTSRDKVSELINLSITGIMCACFAFSFGIASISKEFVPFFFGKGYDECVLLIKVFAIIILFKSISNIIRTQYMIPFKKEKSLTICVILGALVNIIANYILIKVLKLGALGATIGTLIAEFVVTIAEIIVINKEIKIVGSLLRTYIFLIGGLMMYMLVKAVNLANSIDYINIMFKILCGGCFYLLFSYFYFKKTNSKILKFIKVK